MGSGFEYDADAVRGFAAVFAEAQRQVEQVRTTLGATSAKASDFGRSWQDEGGEFEEYMAALAADLSNLATHLGSINAKLNVGTDLTVRSDTSGYDNLKTIEEHLGADSPPSGSGRNRPV